MDVQREETAEETNKMEAMLTTKVCLGLQVIILLSPYSLQHQPRYCLRKEQQIIRVIKCPSEVQI